MNERWQRAVPVYNYPIWTRPFYAMLGLASVTIILVLYRSFAGLGPATGMNDVYAWGIWKTFNVMVLTGLGSGAFSIGIAAWLFKRQNLHVVMRTALLTSFLAYFSGILLLGIDVGRPWHFIWVLFPWRWNLHSPLLEVAVCMPAYAMFPLLLENVPPVLEWVHKNRPTYRGLVEKAERIMKKFYPFIVGLAYVLPAMHQSSLGALMLLGGDRVHTLWQTPLLPLLYVWAAGFLGFACVAGTILFCSIMWNRPLDLNVLTEMNRITSILIGSWMVARFVDILVRMQFMEMFKLNIYAGLFWMETLFLGLAFYMLRDSARLRDPRLMFHAHLVTAIGGMLYRFNPTTLAFQARPGSFYFPKAIELFVSAGFISLAIIAFSIAAKKLAILPAPLRSWRDMEGHERTQLNPDVARAQYAVGD
jgi:Ni/Fe-hydrogenase subunit HybB-like protein